MVADENRAEELVESIEPSRGKGVSGVLVLISRLLPFGWLFGTQYRRDFSKVKLPKQHPDYLVPAEYIDEDEVQITNELAERFAKDNLKNQRGIAKTNRNFEDPHWGHSTGYLAGKLEITDIGWLHEDLRVGLFSAARSFDVICRPNFLYDEDRKPLVAISRLSLKIRYDITQIHSRRTMTTVFSR